MIFTSDNGPEDILVGNASHSGVGSAGPFRGRKRSLYEGGIRLPFLVRWPGKVPAGKVNDRSVVSAVDFLPTVARLCGVQPPAEFVADGEDVSDILLGGERARVKPLYWEWRTDINGHVLNHSPMLAVREGNWKLLLNPDHSRVELYDIPRDSSEVRNVAESRADIVELLARQAIEWQATLPPGKVSPNAGNIIYRWPK